MMLSCKEVTRLVSESLDCRLPLRQRLAIRLHLLMCRFCCRYQRQLLFLREISRHYAERAGEGEPPASASLSPEARQRLKSTLKVPHEPGTRGI